MRVSLLRFCSCLLFLMSAFSQALAQGACTQTLNTAQDDFERGHLYGIPAQLKGCLDKGFTDQEKIQAYWLLTRTYLIIDDPISAENSYMELLKLDPEYDVDEENDPIEIVYLSKKFKTTPIIEYTVLKAGVNMSKPAIIHQYGTYNTSAGSPEEYFWGFDFQAGPAIDLNITDNIGLGIEVLFSPKTYTSQTSFFNTDELSYKERQVWIDIPLYARYERKYGKWYPFVYGGYSFNFLLAANATSTLVNNEFSGSFSEEVNESITQQRNFYNTSYIGGIGTRYRIGYRYLSFELRFNGGFTNVLNAENQYLLGDDGQTYGNGLLFKNGRVDSDFRMNSISASLGYIWPKYKPRKIEDDKGFLKNIFKKKTNVKK